MTSEKSQNKNKVEDSNFKKSKRKRLEEIEADEEDVTPSGIDQTEVDEVLAAQEFPMQKIGKKKKKEESEESKIIEEEKDETPEAISYLLSWKNKDDGWKFKKLRQTWLLQNMYDKDKLSKTNFKILLEYLENLKGTAKQQTLEEAQKILDENESNTEQDSESKRKTKRALNILRLLT